MTRRPAIMLMLAACVNRCLSAGLEVYKQWEVGFSNLNAILLMVESSKITKQRQLISSIKTPMRNYLAEITPHFFEIFYENSKKTRLSFFMNPLVQYLWTKRLPGFALCVARQGQPCFFRTHGAKVRWKAAARASRTNDVVDPLMRLRANARLLLTSTRVHTHRRASEILLRRPLVDPRAGPRGPPARRTQAAPGICPP